MFRVHIWQTGWGSEKSGIRLFSELGQDLDAPAILAFSFTRTLAQGLKFSAMFAKLHLNLVLAKQDSVLLDSMVACVPPLLASSRTLPVHQSSVSNTAYIRDGNLSVFVKIPTFFMVLRVILKIHLNLGTQFVYISCHLQMPCTTAVILSAI